MTAARTRGAPPLWWIALLAVMGFYVWAACAHRFALLFHWSDTWVHLALIRRTMEHGWFPGDPFYAGMPTPPYYSLEHLLLAAVSAATAVPPHVVWTTLPALVAVLTVGAVFAWLHALTGDARVAAVGAAVELLVQAPDPAWAVLPYPRVLAITPLVLALRWYRRSQDPRQRNGAVAAGIALGICISIHPFVGAFGALSLLFLDLALAPGSKRPSRRVLVTIGIGLLVGSPWLLNIYNGWRHREVLAPELFGAGPEVWTVTWGAVTLTGYRPDAILQALPWPLWFLVAAGLILSGGRWLTGHASAADRYALCTTAGTSLLLLTPLYGLLQLFAGVWTPRLVQVVPLALLAGLGVVGIVEPVRGGTLAPRVRLGLAIAAIAAGASIAVATARLISAQLQGLARAHALFGAGPLGNWHLEDEVARTGASPEIVLSDPWTSYLLPYYLGCHVVAIPAGHGSAFIDVGARERAVQRVYTAATSNDELRRVLDAYHVDTVALTLRRGGPQAADSEALAQRLRGQPEFKDTGCCESVRLFRYVTPHSDLEGSHGR